MPNTHVPAAGEAMPAANLNRRLALLGGLSAAAALAALPAARAVPVMSPIERAKHHLDELRKAMEEHSGETWWILFKRDRARHRIANREVAAMSAINPAIGRFSRRALLGAIASIPAIGAATAAFATVATSPKVFPNFGSIPAAPAEPTVPPTPDERIAAAIEEIKAAFWEKWPNAPLRIVDTDNIDNGLILFLSHVADDKPGEVRYRRDGLARIAKGGVA